MKLLRLELNRGLHEEFFDISVENISADNVLSGHKSFPCTLSAQTVPTGFKVFGTVDITFCLVCDRCLNQFNSSVTHHFEIWLTPDKDNADNGSLDMIWFPDSMDEIDLGPIFHDLILLEVPYSKTCSESCKGLCPTCGNDLNHERCSCESKSGDPRWEVLKELNKY